MIFSADNKNCGVCFESVATGQGRAILTADCSHTFHLSCISKTGNPHCPVCLSRWKETPFTIPNSNTSSNVNHSNWNPFSPTTPQFHPVFGQVMPSPQFAPVFGQVMPSPQFAPVFGQVMPLPQFAPVFGQVMPSPQFPPVFGYVQPSPFGTSPFGPSPLGPSSSSPLGTSPFGPYRSSSFGTSTFGTSRSSTFGTSPFDPSRPSYGPEPPNQFSSGKVSWPELVGVNGEDAVAVIKSENRELKDVHVHGEKQPVTFDYRTDRVRVFVNYRGKVVRPPKIG